VFDQKTLAVLNRTEEDPNKPVSFDLSCIEFAYILDGTATFTITMYIDSSGGSPDFDSLTQVGSSMTGSLASSSGETELVTVTPSSPMTVTFPNSSANLIIALTINTFSGSFFYGSGQYNPKAVGKKAETFVSGPCLSEGTVIEPASVFNKASDLSLLDNYQWYVQVTKAAPSSSTSEPTEQPSGAPTVEPIITSTTAAPSTSPTAAPTTAPTAAPTAEVVIVSTDDLARAPCSSEAQIKDQRANEVITVY
jgi:hypothetical protein